MSTFNEEDIVKEIFRQQVKSPGEKLTEEEEKNAEKLYLDFYRAGIANLQTNETDPRAFFDFLAEPGAVVLIQQAIAPKYTAWVIKTLLTEFVDYDSRCSLMSHMMNICSLIQEFSFIPPEARQEIAVAGLEEILNNTASPFHKDEKKNIYAIAQTCSILSTTYMSRVKEIKDENLARALEYNKFAIGLLDPDSDYEFVTTLFNNQTIILKRMKRFDDALISFDALLKIRTQEKTPLEWGLSNINLGNLYVDEEFLKKCQNPSDNFVKAIQCYENALKVLKKDAQNVQWTIAMMSLGYTLYLSSNQVEVLEKASKILDDALSGIKKEVRKGEYGLVQYHRCNCLWKLWEKAKRVETLQEALKAVDEANSVMSKENPKLTEKKKAIMFELNKK